MRQGNWFLNNLKWIFALTAVIVTGAVVAGTMWGSYQDYLAYEKVYYENDLDLRSNSPAEPGTIEINDEFVSKYSNVKSYQAEDLNVTTAQEDYIVDDYIDLTSKGGSVSLALTLENKSFLDIDFVVSSTREYKQDEEIFFGVKDLLTNVDFIVNGETMEETIDLENKSGEPEWHHLVMSNFALPAGDVTLTIKSKSGKSSLMPQLRSISLFSSEVLNEVIE